MKKINFENSNYNRKEELKIFVDSITDLVTKYNKSFENADQELKKICTNIDKKNATINKYNDISMEYSKKLEELESLKNLAKCEISELENRKKTIDFSDNEVKKMELDDIDSLISNKNSKITKADSKIMTTKEKIKVNNENLKNASKEIKDLEKMKNASEESLYRTKALLELINNTHATLNDGIKDILESSYFKATREVVEKTSEPVLDNKVAYDKIEKEIPLEEPKKEEEISFQNYNLNEHVLGGDLNFDMEEPTSDVDTLQGSDLGDIKPITSDMIEPSTFNYETELNSEISEKNEYDYIDITDIENVTNEIKLPDYNETKDEVITPQTLEENSVKSVSPLLEGLFDKETISLDNFNEKAIEKMSSNIDRVMKNMSVLKKHGIPLDYTTTESDVYTEIDPADLDDLLNIITTDEDGNGMGFGIEFAYNVLNELTKVDVDKLIEVYNREFMNITNKSGLIDLLKKTNPNLGDFENNRIANINELASFGVTRAEDIAEENREFINMDAPLFTNLLNMFDQEDLVEKLNANVDVIPQIMEYWKNN